MQVRVDELMRATQGRRLSLLDLEHLEPNNPMRAGYEDLASQARIELRRAGVDTGTPEAPVDVCRLS